jgi:hypothetical protein
MRMWHEAGCPKGRKDDYLERARELQAFVKHPGAALVPLHTDFDRLLSLGPRSSGPAGLAGRVGPWSGGFGWKPVVRS